MWRAAICLGAALVLASPSFSHAQYNDTDVQHPKEYNDEDSQPLSLASYAVYPLGFALEWLVARPLHYVTGESPLAPAFRPADNTAGQPAPVLPIYPDYSLLSEHEAEMPPQEIVIQPGASGQTSVSSAPEQPVAPAPTIPQTKPAHPAGQPALQ
ncbi:MAG: hypothetical protein ACREQI_05405 [Candidatus Binataceae bacterium]